VKSKEALSHVLLSLAGDTGRERIFMRDILHAMQDRALVALIVLLALYGATAGANAGGLQALSAAIKLPLLFLGTLAICFPGFFVIQVLGGSRPRLQQVPARVVGSPSPSCRSA